MSSRPVVVHVDVNETVILLDSVQGFTTDITVNRILAKSAYGIVRQARRASARQHAQAPSAAWCVDAALSPFYTDAALRSALESHTWERVDPPTAAAVSFKTFASDLFPDDDARCNQLINAFTLLPHGVALRPEFEKLMSALGADQERLLPSFLHFVQWLCAQPREFRIVFRTFGSDLPLIARLFNEFCEGRHPHFPSFCADGRNGTLDLRLDVSGAQSGVFLRRSERLDDAHFHPVGATTQAPRADDEHACQEWVAAAAAAAASSSSPAAITFDSDANDAGGSSESSGLAVGAAFNAWIARFRVACVRDFYAMWRASDGAPTAGKLVFIHPSASVDRELHVFFDDYVAQHADDCQCIVDARCARTGNPLPLSHTLGKHLVRVHTAEAILDQHYFIRAFQDAEGRSTPC